MHRLGRHPQQPGRGRLIALGQFQGPAQQLPPRLAEIVLQGKAGLGFGEARPGIGGAQGFGYLEVVRVQEVFGGQAGGALQGVFQVPDVPRPGITLQPGQSCRRQALGTLQPGVEAVQDMQGELGDVAASFPQRRQVNLAHVQAVIQVFPELPLPDGPAQVLIGGGDEAHVHPAAGPGPQGFHHAILEHPQELDLGRQGQFPQFIQEQGAAVRLGKFPRLVPERPGEGAFDMAEEQAFHQFRRDGAAIDGNETIGGAAAEPVDEPGKEFLAGAGLPQDQDGNVRRGQQGARFQGLVNAGMIADNAALPDGLLQVRRRQVRNLGGGQGTADDRQARPGQVDLLQERPVGGDEFGWADIEQRSRQFPTGRQQQPAGVHLGGAGGHGDVIAGLAMGCGDFLEMAAQPGEDLQVVGGVGERQRLSLPRWFLGYAHPEPPW